MPTFCLKGPILWTVLCDINNEMTDDLVLYFI